MSLRLVTTDPVRYSVLGTFEPGSEEWAAERADRIGGSEIAAVVGLSRFSTYYRLFHQKLGNLPPELENPYIMGGRRQEADVREWFAETHPDLTVTGNLASFVREDRPWQLATPDGFVADDTGMRVGLLEVKVTEWNMADDWGQEGSADIPPGYYCQVLWQLNVLGLRRCWIAVRFGAFGYRTYYIDLDLLPDADQDTAILVERGEEFISRLLGGDWPTPDDGTDITYQAVREMHPEIEDREVVIDQALADEYVTAQDLLAQAEANAKRWSSLVLEAMGTAKHAMVDAETPFRIAYRTARKRKDGKPGTPYLAIDSKMKTRTIAHSALTEGENQ